ncbi:hypothetical protein QZH41_019718, partial [Actinostola sp. cb2023]
MKRKDRSSASANEERKSKKSKKVSDLEEVQESSKLDFSSADKLFSSLIAPTTNEAFFSEYWEKKPLLIERGDTEFYGPLFNKSDLEAILKKEEIEFVNDVNVCRYEDGDKLYMNGDMGTRATLSRVSKDMKERKATVQFHQPQRFKDILWKLNGHFESIFGCLVGANVYITPPDSQGLAPHHDDVEIFILQLEGKKQWKLYKAPKELPQDYSPDLEQESIGEPTHEFELQPGDMVYFPRGTVHQAVTLKGEGSTHITLSTYQQNSWGNLLSNVITDAIEKAMEADVEFRRGLPVNFYRYMGIGMEGDGKAKNKQEDFNNQVKQLLSRLVKHIDTHSSVDKVAAEFMANRLPPIEQKEEAMKDQQGDGEKAPAEGSEVKFRFPEYVRVSVGEVIDIPVGIVEDVSDDEDDEQISEGADDESEDEPMEESEVKPKKGSKSKKKTPAVKQVKQEKAKSKGKKKKDQSDDEEDDDSGDEKSKSKKSKQRKETEKSKDKKSKGRKGKKKEESDEEEEEEEDEKPKSKKGKSQKDAQTKKKGGKGKKGKKSESEDEEDDEEDESFELGDEDTEEDSDDEDESDEEGEEGEGPWVFVHHSLNNDPSMHMMGPQQ